MHTDREDGRRTRDRHSQQGLGVSIGEEGLKGGFVSTGQEGLKGDCISNGKEGQWETVFLLGRKD